MSIEDEREQIRMKCLKNVRKIYKALENVINEIGDEKNKIFTTYDEVECIVFFVLGKNNVETIKIGILDTGRYLYNLQHEYQQIIKYSENMRIFKALREKGYSDSEIMDLLRLPEYEDDVYD